MTEADIDDLIERAYWSGIGEALEIAFNRGFEAGRMDAAYEEE